MLIPFLMALTALGVSVVIALCAILLRPVRSARAQPRRDEASAAPPTAPRAEVPLTPMRRGSPVEGPLVGSVLSADRGPAPDGEQVSAG